MAAENNGNTEDQPKVDPQKQYLIEQFGNLIEKVGEGYGGPLQEELIRRMEQTIADFDEEVTEMLENLKIAKKVKSIKNMKSLVLKKINYSENLKVKYRLNKLGEKIINRNLLKIKKFI